MRIGPCILAVTTLTPFLASQTTWHVAAGAAPGGNGSPAAPFAVIQAGILAAATNDIVSVGPGRYLETIDFLGRAITVRGAAGPLRTIIDGGFAGSVVRFASAEGANSVLDGFTITRGRGPDGPAGFPGAAGGVHCSGSSPRILNCVVTGNRGGNGSAGLPFNHPCCTFALGCIPCTQIGQGFAGGPGGVLCEAGNPLLLNCVVADNTGGDGGFGGYWTPLYGDAGPGGVYAVVSASGSGTFAPVILHGTIVNNVAGASGANGTSGILASALNPFGGGITVHVANSIVWGNTVGAGFSSAIAFSWSAVAGMAGPGNISQDPLLVDAGAGDWHLGTYSPCFDAGSASPPLPYAVTVTQDFEGHPRNVHAAPDMGADEITLRVDIAQPGGPGAAIALSNDFLTTGREYYNCFTVNEPCPDGPGAGPFGGLCAADPTFLLFQLSLPLGAAPIHFAATSAAQSFPPIPVPPLVLEVVSFDLTGGVFGLVSPVRRFAVQ